MSRGFFFVRAVPALRRENNLPDTSAANSPFAGKRWFTPRPCRKNGAGKYRKPGFLAPRANLRGGFLLLYDDEKTNHRCRERNVCCV